MRTSAYQHEKPADNPFVDAYGSPMKVGDEVLFFLSGRPAYGRIKEIKKFEWGVSDYHKKHAKPGDPVTWLFDCLIILELSRPYPTDNDTYSVGHLSRIKTTTQLLLVK